MTYIRDTVSPIEKQDLLQATFKKGWRDDPQMIPSVIDDPKKVLALEMVKSQIVADNLIKMMDWLVKRFGSDEAAVEAIRRGTVSLRRVDQ